MAILKRIQRPALAVLRTIGRSTIMSPRPPRATGGYGLASRGALLLLFAIGVVVAWLAHPAVGVGIMTVAALALLQFLVLQYRGALLRPLTMLWLLVVAAVLGGVIAWFWRDWSGRDGAAGDVLVLVTLISASIFLAGVRWLFQLIFGPHHPQSALPDLDARPPVWFWTGAVAADRATVLARLAPGVDADTIVVELTTDDDDRPAGSFAEPPDTDRFARFELTELDADRTYRLRVVAERRGETVGALTGSFRTFPPAGRPAALTLAFGSCLSTGSNGWVFDTIAGLEPRIFVVTGDLHYENITSRQRDRFLDVYDRIHASAALGRLFRTTPMAYVWDDHDFGDNDSDHSSPSKHAAQSAYRQAVPSYVTGDRTGAIHQELVIGRVRIVITDNRSERGETPGHLIAPDAEAWLIDRISDPSYPVVLWVSPTPWIGDPIESDNWSNYAEQRQRIATAIGDRAANLVMVSGDAHMIAIDDGEHTGYAGPGSGFPVLHAAALDRLGSVKGGPFSHGRYAGAGQFGVVTIDDRGHEIEIELSGRTWTGAEVVAHSFKIATAKDATNATTRGSAS